MLNALFESFEAAFYAFFGFKTSSPEGIIVLLIMDAIFYAGTQYFAPKEEKEKS